MTPVRIRPARHLDQGEDERQYALAEPYWSRLPDLELVRAGRLTPEQLHPLVQEALFPMRPVADGPVGPPPPPPPGAKVRCGGEWHEVSFRKGVLWAPHHSEDERRREAALGALGGPVTGCFTVRRTWTSRQGRLPKALRDQRRALFAKARHGDTAGLLEMLDLGYDAHAREGEGRTLLHYLDRLDAETVLLHLMVAGLDVDTGDAWNNTPLAQAVKDGASESTVRALLSAGADVHVRWTSPSRYDPSPSLIELVHVPGRRHLAFLADAGR